MKTLITGVLLVFTSFPMVSYAQKYEDNGGFNYASIELTGNHYELYREFCTGSYFSKGIYLKKGDTLYFTSMAIYDDRLIRVFPQWTDGEDSAIVQIKTFIEIEDLTSLRISLVGDDSICVAPNPQGIVTLPLSILPIHDIWINQKRHSVFLPANNFLIHFNRPYDSHFIGMLNEPFICRNNSIFPLNLNRWGYFFLVILEQH